MKSVSIINKLVNPFIGLFRWQIYKRPIVFWLSKRLLTSSEIVDLSYLTFTKCLPSVLIVKNSQITTLLKSLAYLQDTTVNSYLFERFVSNFFSNANHFESQFLQDCFVDTLFQGKKDGVFIEIGVGEGKRISNTYFLENYRNWKGLLCEPSLKYHDSIQSLRKSILVKNAVTSNSGQKVKFAEVIGLEEHSTLSQFLDADGHNRKNYKEYEVITATLSEVLETYLPSAEIDYISIDTEGSELNVIKGIDFNLYNIKCISIEHNHEFEKLDQIRKILFSYDYFEIGFGVFAEDVFFVKKNLIN